MIDRAALAEQVRAEIRATVAQHPDIVRAAIVALLGDSHIAAAAARRCLGTPTDAARAALVRQIELLPAADAITLLMAIGAELKARIRALGGTPVSTIERIDS